MIQNPMDVLEKFPVRKSGKQKQLFRQAIIEYAQSRGYAVTTEKGSFGSQNIVIGQPANAKYLITAHYDTCARLPFPNLITPCNLWTFLAYQLLVVALMFAAVFVVAVCLELLFHNELITFWGGYFSLWLMIFMMLLGPANKHNANDNTSGVVTVLEIVASLPEDQRRNVTFVLFDLEEAGLWGSNSYRTKHKKETDGQLILNLDCVGDGDEMMMFPTEKVKKSATEMELLRSVCTAQDGKSIHLREKGFAYYPSDQKNFPYGVGIAAFCRSKWAGLYCDKIHTGRDTILDEKNVQFLRDRLIELVTHDPVSAI